jgi:hypothetical protein
VIVESSSPSSLSSLYHDRKLRELKGATQEEISEMLRGLKGQFEADVMALEEAYIQQKKQLEEALGQSK